MKKLYICSFDNNKGANKVGGIQKRIYAENVTEAAQFFRDLGYENIRVSGLKNPKHDYLEVLMVNDKRFPMGKYKKNPEDFCDTCGTKLVSGRISGNHVRGNNDELCDKCVNK